MISKVVFLRSQLPKTDSRLQRYISIINGNIKHTIIGWDRTNNQKNELENEILYKKYSQIGGGIKNIFNLITWNIFIIIKLIKYRNTYSHIHAIDFDTCMPAIIMKFLFRKRFIFDIYDKYTDSRNISSFYGKIIDTIEKYCCLHCDFLILPDECRKQQLNLSSNQNNICIIENIPIYNNNNNIKKTEISYQNEKYDFILSYVGVLEKNHRGLENLLDVISNNKYVQLLIAGNGALKDIVEDYSNKYKNIVYFGEVDSKEALEIMNSSDIIVGMYYKTIKNHLYASPNKYYEHLMLGKPLLTTFGTNPGDKVIQYDTGFAIGENIYELENFVMKLNKSILHSKGCQAKNIWFAFGYDNYINVIRNKYYNIIEAI